MQQKQFGFAPFSQHVLYALPLRDSLKELKELNNKTYQQEQ